MKQSSLFESIHRVGAYPLLVGLAFAVFGCASAIPHLSSADKTAARSEWANVDLDHGRSVYIRNCGACHRLYSPTEHSSEQWKQLFGEMAGRAHLSQDDSTAVVAYLSTASKLLAGH